MRFTLKEEKFSIYDSGSRDSNRILIFCVPKMLSLLAETQSWYADGTVKIIPEQFFQPYTFHAAKDSLIITCVYALLTNKVNQQIKNSSFTNQYIENADFALIMKMLPSLAFVPEYQVVISIY